MIDVVVTRRSASNPTSRPGHLWKAQGNRATRLAPTPHSIYGESMLKEWFIRAPAGTVRYWITLVTVVSRLGATRSMRGKMFVLGLIAPIRDRLVGPRESCLRLRFGRLDVPWVVGPKSDFDVLNEILVQRVYEFGLPETAPELILDLGAHMGASVLYFRERFPDARIVALEPDPTTYERLLRNTSQLTAVEVRRQAVSPHDGPVRFFPARQGWVSSLSRGGEPISVEGRTLGRLLSELGGADLLKIDVEGAEREVLDTDALANVAGIIGEYHDTADPSDREHFFTRLRENFELEPNSFINFAGRRRPTA